LGDSDLPIHDIYRGAVLLRCIYRRWARPLFELAPFDVSGWLSLHNHDVALANVICQRVFGYQKTIEARSYSIGM
jgi:hypothetical protein